jgi:hypothetical protein
MAKRAKQSKKVKKQGRYEAPQPLTMADRKARQEASARMIRSGAVALVEHSRPPEIHTSQSRLANGI